MLKAFFGCILLTACSIWSASSSSDDGLHVGWGLSMRGSSVQARVKCNKEENPFFGLYTRRGTSWKAAPELSQVKWCLPRLIAYQSIKKKMYAPPGLVGPLNMGTVQIVDGEDEEKIIRLATCGDIHAVLASKDNKILYGQKPLLHQKESASKPRLFESILDAQNMFVILACGSVWECIPPRTAAMLASYGMRSSLVLSKDNQPDGVYIGSSDVCRSAAEVIRAFSDAKSGSSAVMIIDLAKIEGAK